MSTIFLVVIALVVVGVGFAYYEHKQNTLAEVDIGSHQLSIQKN